MSGVVTGSSVLAIAFDGGVAVAADTLVSYGSMARFKSCERIMTVNNQTVVAASGDYADYQFLTRVIEQKQIDELQWNDGQNLSPKALHSWVTRVAYNRRSQFNPLYNTWIIAGMQENEDTEKLEPFIGYVDKLGTAFKSNLVTTGMAQYLCTSLLREIAENPDILITEDMAKQTIKECMQVLYYRDTRAFPNYDLCIIKADGVHRENHNIVGNWQIADTVKSF